jgi:hypothetical protein
MSLQEWEQDVINRQRNIVFPDTNLNESRFYRNIVSGKAVFSAGQKISLGIMILFFTMTSAVAIAGAIGLVESGFVLLPLLAGLGWLGFWIFLAVKAYFPDKPVRKYRRGYRTSTKRQS